VLVVRRVRRLRVALMTAVPMAVIRRSVRL
jgi:hypothetical protein